VVSDEIARNMDAVQTIATEMLAGSEESVAQSEQLHELAFQLERSVGGFNLESSGMRMGLHDDTHERAHDASPRRLTARASHGEDAPHARDARPAGTRTRRPS
jgi:hypothetical protein